MNDQELTNEIEAQRGLMILVATGRSNIEEVNSEYREHRQRILSGLEERGLEDPNPYTDLWRWHAKWTDGTLPTYQSRRAYIASLYDSLIDCIRQSQIPIGSELFIEPTGWERVDRGVDRIKREIDTASREEEFQYIGLLCRETLISLAQAVYDSTLHPSSDGVQPSDTDAKRMLEAYFSVELAGGSNQEARRHANAALDLANSLQHRRTAVFRDAALCAEATSAVVNIVAIVSGRRSRTRPHAT